MAAHWYYGRDNRKIGPFSAVEMKTMASCGRILPDDTVWQEGVERGVPARKVQHLFSPAAAASAVAEAPPPQPAPPGTEGPEIETSLSAGPALEASAPALSSVSEAGDRDAAPAKLEGKGPVPSSGWVQEPVRTGRASPGKGAVIVGQDGSNVKVRKKCTVCGHLDSSWVTMPIRAGTTKLIFYCIKCRKTRDVEVMGTLH
jgi:hypothetical protein